MVIRGGNSVESKWEAAMEAEEREKDSESRSERLLSAPERKQRGQT